ncbi:hypothetical protein [Lysobacter sp. ESA13C]|uniref:hypothetical protein n=1 Tax=Lysobacter sp. ESA13C TaxID=2862676 RepID=UPI001CBC4F11|nr:hypothetical protein [Lysobacter sp. ESA13C]
MKKWVGVNLGLLGSLSAILWFDAALGQAQQRSADQRASVPFDLPEFASGPYIADPQVIALLDRYSPDGDCERSGALVFPCLIQALAESHDHEVPVGPSANPFNLQVASEIRATIEQDLTSYRTQGNVFAEQQIHPAFLAHAGSRMELVGIVNRMDRQFIKDIVPGKENAARCGEISVIYRFSYSIKYGSEDFNHGMAASRLPVTMNVVFPAVPETAGSKMTSCREAAQAWMAEMGRPRDRTPAEVVKDIENPSGGVLSGISGQDIERIELNIQAFRRNVSSDKTKLGSTAEYVIRVFRWDSKSKRFIKSYLTNQIDRARLLGASKGDANSCDFGVSKPLSRKAFVDYLSSPKVLADIDTGTLNIQKEFLACRATSVSPGGQARSGNSLYWKSGNAATELLRDSEIEAALARARERGQLLSFMRSAEDMRLRLNELSCTGCHQSRAVAGFHFPGADREGTPSANAVLLPGSPHFYGDQLRRSDILAELAQGRKLTAYELASGYSSRPLNKYSQRLRGTQLIGGWGGACLVAEAQVSSQRKWDCQVGLTCKPLFESKNAPGLGTCVPNHRQEIGDALQVGRVITDVYGQDHYTRLEPKNTQDALIPAESLPAQELEGNSYYGAHQEWYYGRAPAEDESPEQRRKRIRDAQTGGFPGGMLRLSECRNLPDEATCGLVASSGFNDCLEKTGPSKSLAQCFAERTSYAGMRACEVSSPCRDDYICLKPMGYTIGNATDLHGQRRRVVPYRDDDFGQQRPDEGWLSRNNGLGDRRGICIPPYFVFQFRSDKHPAPLSKDMK